MNCFRKGTGSADPRLQPGARSAVPFGFACKPALAAEVRKLCVLAFAVLLSIASAPQRGIFHAQNVGSASAPGITPGAAAVCNVHAATCTITGLSTSAGQTLIFGGYVDNNAVTITAVQLSDGVTNCTQDAHVAVSGSHDEYWYRCSNIPAGITGATITASGSQFIAFIALPVAGLIAGPVDAMDLSGNAQASPSGVTGSMTTANPRDLVCGIFVDRDGGFAFTGSGSWTLQLNNTSSANVDIGMTCQVVSTTTTYAPAVTLSAAGHTIFGLGASYKGN